MSSSRLHILNTRPRHQAAGLSESLRAAGFLVSELPLIDIVPRALPADEKRLLLDLDRYDGVFFVSANAVKHGLDAIADYWPQWPHDVMTYAVGASTAALLQEAGLTVQVPEQADSEGLLHLAALQSVNGKRFLLLRGEGGRELLRETLQQRGAQVDVLELYRRELPGTALQQWRALEAMPDVVVLTSPDALRHWQQVTGSDATLPLWLVVSPRLRELAEVAGAHVVEASGADAHSLVRALQKQGPQQQGVH